MTRYNLRVKLTAINHTNREESPQTHKLKLWLEKWEKEQIKANEEEENNLD